MSCAMSDSSSESDSVGPVLGSGGVGHRRSVGMAITSSVTPTPASIKGKGERSETSGFTSSRPRRPIAAMPPRPTLGGS